MLIYPKLSTLVRACRNYSLTKLARVFATQWQCRSIYRYICKPTQCKPIYRPGLSANMLQTITKYFINYFTNHCCHHYNVMSKGAMCTLDMRQFNGTITRLCRALERCYVREHSGGGLWTSTLSTTYHSIYSLSVNFISFVIIAIQLNTAAGVHTDSHVIDVCSLVIKNRPGL